MRSLAARGATLAAAFAALVLLHWPLLRLPYYWDEAGYYIPAALDYFQRGWLIPQNTLATGHTPLVIVYLATAWRLFGFSPLVTRLAMLLVAAATIATLYALARRVTEREPAVWSALLLALSPLFFAQSSLAHLDLAAALFTTLSILALLNARLPTFALAATLAILSKETAVVLLPVAWIYVWRKTRGRQRPLIEAWVAAIIPIFPLAAWALYYHQATGYWTGNAEYLSYNLYSTLNPLRILLTLLRRIYEVGISGFNWLLAGGAVLGIARGRGNPAAASESPAARSLRRDFFFLTGGLSTVYLLFLSVVGGAILPRYLLPIVPVLILAGVTLLWRLPRKAARAVLAATAVCFVAAWFINPPSPFPFEDNLSYADFVRLHQQAARFLEVQPGQPRILTAWPGSDELSKPELGYVTRPLKVVPLAGFEAADFAAVQANSFDLLYLYSRKWEPPSNWLDYNAWTRRLGRRYFDYSTQVRDATLVGRFRLRLVAQFERRGQWVRIYAR